MNEHAWSTLSQTPHYHEGRYMELNKEMQVQEKDYISKYTHITSKRLPLYSGELQVHTNQYIHFPAGG